MPRPHPSPHEVNCASFPSSFKLGGGRSSFVWKVNLPSRSIRNKPGSWVSTHKFSSPEVHAGPGAFKKQLPHSTTSCFVDKGAGSFKTKLSGGSSTSSTRIERDRSFLSEFDSSARWGAVSAGIDITRGIINYRTQSAQRNFGPVGLEVPTDAQIQDRANLKSSQLDSVLGIAGGVATLGALFL